MPTRTKEKSAPASDPFEGSHLPASFTIELADYEAQLHITPQTASSCHFKQGEQEAHFMCALSHNCFTVPRGGILYMIRAQGNEDLFDPHFYVSPETVAKGSDYIRRRVLEKAGRVRSTIRYEMERVVMMERGAAMDVVFDLPEA